MAKELQIRLTEEQAEQLKTGRLVIDVETPAPAEVTQAAICESTGLPVRNLPASDKNNFRASGTCADCAAFRRKHTSFRCTKKTFRGDCYVMAALRFTCDLFQPKGVN